MVEPRYPPTLSHHGAGKGFLATQELALSDVQEFAY
jgi:hypothetical protein